VPNLPFKPPLKPMLAKGKDDIPRGEGWLYEPKWDGFRAIIFVDGDDTYIMQSQRAAAAALFPGAAASDRQSLPATLRCRLRDHHHRRARA